MTIRCDFETSKLLNSLVIPVPKHHNSVVADALGRRTGAEAVGSRYLGGQIVDSEGS